jgi:hypothetical protein
MPLGILQKPAGILCSGTHMLLGCAEAVNLLGKYINTIKRKAPLYANTMIDVVVNA